MSKISVLLAFIGLALLFASFLPMSAGADPKASVPPSTFTPIPDLVTQGAALFQAKGCTTCHRHDAVGGGMMGIGPDLSRYQTDPIFVRRWLRDPASIRPDTRMPNLQLTPAEIETLIAFLQSNTLLIDLSKQARELARKEVPDPVLRQIITDLQSTAFLFTDEAATVEVEISLPESGATPENWKVTVLSVAKLVGHTGAELDPDNLRIGPYRVAREMLKHWPGCTIRSMILTREQNALRWLGFCDTSQGVVSGHMDNLTGIFRPSVESPAGVPVIATPRS
jgi:cytochrome c2